MTAKIRQVHGLNVPRDVVYLVMGDLDHDGLQARGGVGVPKRPRRRGPFTCEVKYLYMIALRMNIVTIRVFNPIHYGGGIWPPPAFSPKSE